MKYLYFTIIVFSLVHVISISAQDSIFIDDQNMIAVDVLYKTNKEISFRELGKEDTFTLNTNKVAHVYEAENYSIYYLPSLAAKNHHLSKLNPGIEINAEVKEKADNSNNDSNFSDYNGSLKLSDADQIKAEKEKIKQQIIQAIKNSRFQQNRIVLITNQGKIKGRLIDVKKDQIIVVSGRSVGDYHKISYKGIEKLQIRVMGTNRFIPGIVAASFGGMVAYYAIKMTVEGDTPSDEFQMVYLNNALTKVTVVGSYILGARSNSRRFHYNISHSKTQYSDFVKSIEKVALK